MRHILKFLSFIFLWVNMFIIIFYLNIYNDVGGWDIGLFWKLFILVIGGVAYKMLNKRINIWDIQSKHKDLRVIIGLAKMFIVSGVVFWLWESLYKSYENIHVTLLCIFISIIIGCILRLWALWLDNRYKKKRTII